MTDTDFSLLRLEGLDHLNHLLSGEATDRDAVALLAWRNQSEAHEAAFRAAVRLRTLVQTVETRNDSTADDGAAPPLPPASDDAPSSNVIPFVRPVPGGIVTRRRFLGAGIAASVAGGAILTGRSLDLLPSPVEALADYHTGPGERRLIRLSRDISVDLNTRTSINLRHGRPFPAVELLSGEAVVDSGRGSAELLAGGGTSVGQGGRFLARRDGNAVCITCLAGTVRLQWNAQQRRLAPSDAVRYDDGMIGAVTRGADAALLTAWQGGTLIFRNMPMVQVVAEINRYRAGRVFLANRDLGRKTLSGTYQLSRLDDFFRQVQMVLGVGVTRLPGNVVMLT